MTVRGVGLRAVFRGGRAPGCPGMLVRPAVTGPPSRPALGRRPPGSPARPPGARPPGSRPPGLSSSPSRRFPPWLVVLVATAALLLVAVGPARAGRPGAPAGSPGVACALSLASNTVKIRLIPGAGPSGHRTLARSHLTVIEDGIRYPRSGSGSLAGGMIQVPVPAGRQTHLLVQVRGPQPLRRILSVTTPPALRSSGPAAAPAGCSCRCPAPCAERRPGSCAARTGSATLAHRRWPWPGARMHAGSG